MSSVKVSICIPTYNGAEFVAKAIESILAQTFADFELLVVDDNSDDATMDTVRSFTDSRLRICQNEERLGIPGNWNRCLALARGEYICVFHQDDLMLPENVERKVQVLASDATISFVHSAARMLFEDSAPTALKNWIESADHDFVVKGVSYFRKLFFRGNLVCAPAVVARRQCLLDLGGFDEELGFSCDYEIWMRLCVQGRVAFLSQPLVFYRWHAKNASHIYRFERGVKEQTIASTKALQHYIERTGRHEEEEILHEATISIASLRQWAVTLERGKAWLEEQLANWQTIATEREKTIQEQTAWTAELERGKAWLEEQLANWQTIATEREKTIQEQTAWTAELERGKAWLEEQLANWQTIATEREKTIQEQTAWTAELERGKAWLEEQWLNWQREAGDRDQVIQKQKRLTREREQIVQEQKRIMRQRESIIQEWQKSLWGQIGLRLGALRHPSKIRRKRSEEKSE